MFIETDYLDYIITKYPNTCKYFSGSKIIHEIFGRGELLQINLNKSLLEIKFNNNGTKRFDFLVLNKNLITGLEISDKKYKKLLSEIDEKEEELKIEIRSRQISAAISRADFVSARKLFQDIEDHYPRELLEERIREKKAREKEKFVKEKINEIEKALEKYDFDSAEAAYQLIQSDFAEISYNKLVEPARAEQRKIQQEKIRQVTLKKIEQKLQNYDFESAEHLYQEIKTFCPKSAYSNLVAKYVDYGIRKIKQALDQFDYDSAEREYQKIQSKYPKNLYTKLMTSAKQAQIRDEQERITKETLNKIELKLKLYDFDAADELYQGIKAFCPKLSYLNLVEKYKKKRLEEELNQLLKESIFIQADKLNDSEKLFSMDEYKNIKAPYVKDFIKNKYKININTEKANALSLPHQNTLITARAGSGKTLLLALKAAILIDCYGYHPDQLMVMAFNRKARGEIGDRIRKRLNHPGFLNARTFHSLAYRLINPKQDILFDENQYSVNSQKLSGFVQRIVKDKIKNPVFMDKLYEHFRAETKELKSERFHLSDEEYFEYRRNLTYVTLDGLNVKSSGEKIISDFLFEHGISYYYEDSRYWGKEIYRPDFSLYENQQDFIIEFWGIDESDPKKQVPDDWTVTWYEYYQEMQSKRKYCQTNSITLIEFSVADLRQGREEFEKTISRKLRSNGIRCEKLAHDELIKKVKENDRVITRITSLFTQFIQKAKKKMWYGNEVQRRLKTYTPAEEREEIFLDLATRVYLEYEDLLIKENKIDFDEMMREAIDLIHRTKGNCTISFGHNKSHEISMNNLKWILIDEYQDFSEEFLNLINAIRKFNSEVRLFCVGDNWQAINGFAGSDLKYFDNFSEYIWPVFTENLVTNFRSQKEIIRWGNALMKGLGEPSKHLPENQYGKVYLDNMDDVWIEQRNEDKFQNQKNEDEKFKISTPSLNKQNTNYYKIAATKYLKLCHKIITSSDDGEKSVAILSRRNWIDGIPLSHFRNKLIDCLVEDSDQNKKSLKDRIRIGTVHKYKGLEADVVIILQACNRSFPLIHPDNSLFYFFGDTPQEVIAEEKRLFYVAISRPKSELYLIKENNLECDYIDQILRNDPDLSYSSILTQGINGFNNNMDSNFNKIAEDEIPF